MKNKQKILAVAIATLFIQQGWAAEAEKLSIDEVEVRSSVIDSRIIKCVNALSVTVTVLLQRERLVLFQARKVCFLPMAFYFQTFLVTAMTIRLAGVW
jgi:hypothetical protein